MKILRPIIIGIALSILVDLGAAWALLWFYDSPTVDV